MSVVYPYRAIILGQEHIVRGWKGNTLITDKGIFCVQHIYKNWRIQNFRIFEIATIQGNNKDGWQINGKSRYLLNDYDMHSRFEAIPNDETLRVHRNQICSVAWVQTGISKEITRTLDMVANSWNEVAKYDQERDGARLKGMTGGDMLIHAIGKAFENKEQRELLASWSKPIWLTIFRHMDEPVPLTPEQKAIAQTSAELNFTKARLIKAETAAADTLEEALKKWMRFDPPGTSASTRAKIEKAVKIYITEPEKRSLSKIAHEFKVSKAAVSKWFKLFTQDTGFKVVVHQRHESVREHIQSDAKGFEDE